MIDDEDDDIVVVRRRLLPPVSSSFSHRFGDKNDTSDSDDNFDETSSGKSSSSEDNHPSSSEDSEDEDEDNISLVNEDDDDIGFSKKRKSHGNQKRSGKPEKKKTKTKSTSSSSSNNTSTKRMQDTDERRREKEETLETDMLISETSLITADSDESLMFGPCEYPRPLILRLLRIAGRSSRILKAQSNDRIDNALIQSLLRESRYSMRAHEDEVEGRQRLAAIIAALGLSQDLLTTDARKSFQSSFSLSASSSSSISSFSPAAGKALASVRESLIEAISSAVKPYNVDHSGPPMAAQTAAEDARVYAERSKKRRKLDKTRGELAKVLRSSERLESVNGDRSKISEEDLYWIWVAEKRYPASSFAKSLDEWKKEANKILSDGDAGDCGQGDEEVMQDMPPSSLLSSVSVPRKPSSSISKNSVKSGCSPPEISTASLDVRCTLGAFLRIASQAKVLALSRDPDAEGDINAAALTAAKAISVTPIDRVFGLQPREEIALLNSKSSRSSSSSLNETEAAKFEKALLIHPLTPFGLWLSKKTEKISPSKFNNLSNDEKSTLWEEFRTSTDETLKDSYRKESCAQFLSAADLIDGCSPSDTEVTKAIEERFEQMSDPQLAMTLLPAFQAAQFRLKVEVPIPPRAASDAYTLHMASSTGTSRPTSSSIPLKSLPPMQKGPLSKGLGALLQKKTATVSGLPLSTATSSSSLSSEPAIKGISCALNLVRSLRSALPGFSLRKRIGGYRVGLSEKVVVADVCSDVATMIWTPSPRSGDPERIFNKVGIEAHIEAANLAKNKSHGSSSESSNAAPLRPGAWNALQDLSSPDAIDTCQGTLSVTWSYRISAINKSELDGTMDVNGKTTITTTVDETHRLLKEWAVQFLATLQQKERVNSKKSAKSEAHVSKTQVIPTFSISSLLTSPSNSSSLKTPAVRKSGVLSSLKVESVVEHASAIKRVTPKKTQTLTRATSLTQQNKSPAASQGVDFVPPPPPTSNKTKVAFSRLLSDIMDE